MKHYLSGLPIRKAVRRNSANVFVLVLLVLLGLVSDNEAFAVPPAFQTAQTVPVTINGVPALLADLAVSPDGSLLYGTVFAPSQNLALNVFDTQSNQQIDSISLGVGGNIQSITMLPDGSAVYIPVSTILGGSNQVPRDPHVDIVSISGTPSVQSVNLGRSQTFSVYGPHGSAATPDSSRVYVAHLGENRFPVFDTATRTFSYIPVGTVDYSGIAVTPDGTRVYSANRFNSTIIEISVASNTVTAIFPFSGSTIKNVTSIAMMPDGTRAYVTHSRARLVSVIDIDPASSTYLSEIDTVAIDVAVLQRTVATIDGRAVLLTSPTTDEVFVIDTDPNSSSYNTIIQTIPFPTGFSPRNVAFHPDGRTGYVSSPDHKAYTVIRKVVSDTDGDGVLDDADNCPSTIIPESVPTKSLGVNRFALVDGGDVFDTTSPNGNGPGRSYSTTDTAGCSCTQIIDALGLGKGHTKFGCSISAMDDWVNLVTP